YLSFFNVHAPTTNYTLSLHDALPILQRLAAGSGASDVDEQSGSRGRRTARRSRRLRWIGKSGTQLESVRRDRALADFARARRDEIGRDTSELQSPDHLVCRLLLEKKK